MNIPNDELEFDPFAHEAKKKKTGSSGVAWLALLLALVVAGFNGYRWWTERSQEAEADTTMGEISALRQAHTQLQQSLEALRLNQQESDQQNNPQALASVESEIQAVKASLAELELSEAGDEALLDAVQNAMSSLHERLNGLDTTVAALAKRGETPDKNMDLAEVDYLLRLAGERLDLFGDVPSADHALELAQTYLGALEDPLYLTVRRRIETARQSLAEVPVMDVVQVSGQITALQSKITSIPFPGEISETEDLVTTDSPGVWQRVKNALTPLVKVRRRVDESTLLSLEDKDFLRQGLWLQLETARLALMRRDSSSWDLSLSRATETLQGRFDTSVQATQQAIDAIETLKALPMSVKLPDISAPWTQLRLLREGQVSGRSKKPASQPATAIDSQAESPAKAVDQDTGEVEQIEAGEIEGGESATGESETGEDESADGGGTSA